MVPPGIDGLPASLCLLTHYFWAGFLPKLWLSPCCSFRLFQRFLRDLESLLTTLKQFSILSLSIPLFFLKCLWNHCYAGGPVMPKQACISDSTLLSALRNTADFTISCTCSRHLVPEAAEQLQNITEPPPCLTVGMLFF